MGPKDHIIDTADVTLARSKLPMRIVPNGMCTLFHERRTASQCSDRGWFEELVIAPSLGSGRATCVASAHPSTLRLRLKPASPRWRRVSK
jgi:hypothetical protein